MARTCDFCGGYLNAEDLMWAVHGGQDSDGASIEPTNPDGEPCACGRFENEDDDQ